MKTSILLFAFNIFFAVTVLGQQLANYTLYRDHWNILNPAAISNNYILNELTNSLNASYHRQWNEIDDEGAPTLQTIGFEHVAETFDVVFGGHIINDKTGFIGNTGLYGNFAYRLEMGRRFDQTLSIGLSAGIVQYRARVDKIAFADPEVGALENDKHYFPDFSLGIFYHYDDRIYAGFSVPQTFGLDTRFRTENRDFTVERQQHFYAVVGAYFDAAFFGNESSFIEPSLWLKYVPDAPMSFDANTRYQYGETFWIGVGGGFSLGEQLVKNLHFETGVIIGEGVGVNYGQMKLGFGFDLFLGKVSTLGNGFEVNAVYCW